MASTYSTFKTVFKLQNECPYFQTMQLKKIGLGCSVLDSFLRGGLPLQGVNEIVGESGTGKTQVAMQLSCACVRSMFTLQNMKLGGVVVYICTEDTFPIKRLRQMIDSQSPNSTIVDDVGVNVDVSVNQLPNVMDHLFLEHVNDVDELFRVLQTKVPVLIERFKVKLIIIDSVAAIFRCENEWSHIEKARRLCSLGSLLHRLNRDHQTAVVCINQVTDIISEHNNTVKQRIVRPSLGLTWSNFVTTRIMLAKISTRNTTNAAMGSKPDAVSEHSTVIIRRMDVILSPSLPSSSHNFFINSSGVHGIKE